MLLSADDLRRRVVELVAWHRGRCPHDHEGLVISFGPLVWHAADVLAVDLHAVADEAGRAAGYTRVTVE